MVKNEDVLVLPRTFNDQKKKFHKMKASCNQGVGVLESVVEAGK